MHSCFLVLSFKAGSHWEISPAEAGQLSKAVANVARHYPVAASQKAADWGQLVIVAATISGPRALQSWQTRQPLAQPSGAQGEPQGPLAVSGLGPTGSGRQMPATPSQLDPIAMSGSHATTGTA